jgi:PKD repeat protein
VTLTNSAVIADAGEYKIVFGDGTEQKLECKDTVLGTCRGPITVSHTYQKDGSYTASLVHYGFFGPPGASVNGTVRGKVFIQVGGPIACTKEYRPVCGQKHVVCITTPCNPVQQTYGNRCMMEADGATFVHEGACRADTSEAAADPRCRSWYDGCNTCSRQYEGGPAMCTLRACTQESMTRPYCTGYFTDSANKPPVVSGLSGPTSLKVGESGTWTVQASDPENGQLHYSILWGDESVFAYGLNAAPARDAFSQTATFTHAYSREGTYTVIVVVRDAAGLEAKTTMTVRVENRGPVACTLEYAPVCGRPTGCANTCPPGQYCTMICQLHEPVTYGNRCQMNTAGATFLHEGPCTPHSRDIY